MCASFRILAPEEMTASCKATMREPDLTSNHNGRARLNLHRRALVRMHETAEWPIILHKAGSGA